MKTILVMLMTLILVCSGCAPLTAQVTKPPMGDYGTVAMEYISTGFASKESQDSFRKGLKTDYGLSLKDQALSIKVEGYTETEAYVTVGISSTITFYCTNENGLYKRVVGTIWVLVFVDKANLKVLGTDIVESAGLEILDGWDGKSV